MPELAEVELTRRVWDIGRGARISRVELHPRCRIFRGLDPETLGPALTGTRLESSEARGKQMLFRFSGNAWVGIHLGMAGSLHVESAKFVPGKHDHFVLRQPKRTLVFRDVRHFGRVLLHLGSEPPAWWQALPPELTSPAFTKRLLEDFLTRRARAPLKAILLMQERFPGVGNWMADEILWRARLPPASTAGGLSALERTRLWKDVRWVCRESFRKIDPDWSYPDSWLFQHRWKPGGDCPRCGLALERATIGGRTTCWCPKCQPARGVPQRSPRKAKG